MNLKDKEAEILKKYDDLMENFDEIEDADTQEEDLWHELKEVRLELMRNNIMPESQTGTWDERELYELLSIIESEK